MIGFNCRVRVFAYVKPADMRKQYDGLYALVVSEMNADPLSGDLFLFTNRRRTRAKVLRWDGTGLCLYQKRLERGCFAPLWRRASGKPGAVHAGAVRLSPAPIPPQALTPFLHEGSLC